MPRAIWWPGADIAGTIRAFTPLICRNFTEGAFLLFSSYLRPLGLQHTRLPCPSPSPRASSNSCPLSRWCHPAISYSVVLFSFCLQSFPPSESFLMSWLFASGGQSIGASTPASVLSMNIQGLFPLGLTDLISLQSKGLPRVLLQHHNSKASFLWHSAFFIVQLSHPYMTTGKTIVLTDGPFVGKVMSLLFNMLSRLVRVVENGEQCKIILSLGTTRGFPGDGSGKEPTC